MKGLHPCNAQEKSETNNSNTSKQRAKPIHSSMLQCSLLDVSRQSLPATNKGHPTKVTSPNNYKHNYHSTNGRSTGVKHQSPEREAPARQTALPSPRRFQSVSRQKSKLLTARVPLQQVGRGTEWFRDGEEPDQCLNAYVHPA